MDPPKPSEKKCHGVGEAFVACVKECDLFEIEFGDRDRCKVLLDTFTACIETSWTDLKGK